MSESGYPPVPPKDPTRPEAQPPAPPPVAGGEQSPKPVPQPVPPQAAYPPPGYPPPGYVYAPQPTPGVPPAGYGYPPMQPQPRSRAWMWWTLGILFVIAIIIASCALPFAALFSGGSGGSVGSGDAVAVIKLDGVIAGTGDYYSGTVTPEHVRLLLKKAEEDDRVKAIVLRVDSPGGTVAASEEISTYVRQAKKPIVVSIGDVGASGAYMVSSQADEIWALPGSAVGSIGVIAEIPNVSGLLDKVGVKFQVITAGKHKDVGSPYRPLTKEETALIKGSVDEAYEQFIGIVSSGREMDKAKVRELATGLTWSGEKAKELGLVDQVGTYNDAANAAARKGGIKGDYDTVTYDENFQEVFGSLFSLTRQLGDLKALQTKEALTRQGLPR